MEIKLRFTVHRGVLVLCFTALRGINLPEFLAHRQSGALRWTPVRRQWRQSVSPLFLFSQEVFVWLLDADVLPVCETFSLDRSHSVLLAGIARCRPPGAPRLIDKHIRTTLFYCTPASLLPFADCFYVLYINWGEWKQEDADGFEDAFQFQLVSGQVLFKLQVGGLEENVLKKKERPK